MQLLHVEAGKLGRWKEGRQEGRRWRLDIEFPIEGALPPVLGSLTPAFIKLTLCQSNGEKLDQANIRQG